MQTRRLRPSVPGRFRRRAGVVVQVAVMSTLIMGFGALAVDVGVMYSAKAELQTAADSAALAAAASLSPEDGSDPVEMARQRAAEYAGRHRVYGDQVQLNPYSDVELGKAVYNPATDKFEFQPTDSNHDAVRITVRRTEDSAGGPIPLMFANIMGVAEKELWARASAVLIPRDIAVVIDLSNSMCWDSQLRFWNRTDGGYSNLRDVWAALDGPAPEHPYLPGSELDTEYADDTGPSFGQMNEWGDPLIPGAYDVATDPGLVYLPRGVKWLDDLHSENVLEEWPASRANEMLLAGGYNVWERWALLTNECAGYLTPPETNALGFTSRVIWEAGATGSTDKITVYLTSGAGSSALSNFQIAVPSAALATALATASSQYGHPVSIINPDPHTGLVGIKFEETDLGENGVVETEWFSFHVPRYTVYSTEVACKSGPAWATVTHNYQAVDKSNTTRWRLRVGAVLGVNVWHSGMAGGYVGNGDGTIDSDAEVTWAAAPDFAINWNWKTYIDNGGYTNPSQFRYRYGLKTFTDFLLEKQPQSNQTDGLWATPEQPLRATKDAVQTMVNVITALDSLDHLSLEIFATTARHQVNLTDDLQAVADSLYTKQSGHWDRSTNMGGGIQKAIEELRSVRARAASAKVIVLMSDGVPNVTETGASVADGDWRAKQYALSMAQMAADEGMCIYAVSVGYSVDRDLMQQIATLAHGQEFYAAGSPEEYTEQLEDIFRALGGKRPVALIE